MNEAEEVMQLNIFPNPADEQFAIYDLPANIASDELIISDLTGRRS